MKRALKEPQTKDNEYLLAPCGSDVKNKKCT